MKKLIIFLIVSLSFSCKENTNIKENSKKGKEIISENIINFDNEIILPKNYLIKDNGGYSKYFDVFDVNSGKRIYSDSGYNASLSSDKNFLTYTVENNTIKNYSSIVYVDLRNIIKQTVKFDNYPQHRAKWSPNGKLFMYKISKNRNHQIAISNRMNNHIFLINRKTIYQPNWSFDNSKIIYQDMYSVNILDYENDSIIKNIKNNRLNLEVEIRETISNKLNFDGSSDVEFFLTFDERHLVFRTCENIGDGLSCLKFPMNAIYIYDIDKKIQTRISPDLFSCNNFTLTKDNKILYEGVYGSLDESKDFYEKNDIIIKKEYTIE